MSRHLQQLIDTSHLFGGNAAFVESLYERWLSEPGTVPEHWRAYFERLNGGDGADIAHGPIRDELASVARANGALAAAAPTTSASAEFAEKQANVLRLVNAYRVRGHQRAQLDPLHLTERPPVPDLQPGFHHLTDADLDTVFNTGSLQGTQEMKLRDIVDLLETVYCGHIGYEYMHITDTNQRRWLQERIENAAGQYVYDREDRIEILRQLTAAEGLEKYLHRKYVGQK